jgi:branched-chain amino acid transport system substrate-binding protein
MRRTATAGLLAAAMTVAACGGDDSTGGGGGGDTSPIKIGAIMTKTGTPFSFGAVGVEPMGKAVYDKVNAEGGIRGRKIEWIVADDANTPQGASQAARKLIQQDQVVALAGDSSYLNCTTNRNFFVQQNVKAIEFSPDVACYESKNIAPVNPGPFVSTTLMLQYGADDLGFTRQCIIQTATNTRKYTEDALADFERLSGQKMPYKEVSVPPSVTDFTPYLLKAKQQRCESITTPGGPQQAAAIASQMKAQGMSDVVLFFSGGSYDPAIAKAVAKSGIKAYLPSEFEPFTEEGSANEDWMATAKAGKAPLNVFTQGAYLAATYMVTVLKSIEGEINRESVSKAFETMKPISNPMTGTPFVFGPGDSHVPNRSVKIMKLEDGVWVQAKDEFMTLPDES